MHKRTVVDLLKGLVKEIESLSEEEWDKYERGELRFGFIARLASKGTTKKELTHDEAQRIVESLNLATSRQEAMSFLEDLGKLELERLAKKFDVLIKKSDKVEDARSRIIESVVGARLSSRAIRGEQP